MQKKLVQMSDIKLVGLSVRTNNANEMNPSLAKIGAVMGQFFGQDIASSIQDRHNPGVTLAAYTQYDSDEHGDYTYFLGEQVTAFTHVPANLQTLIIPATHYQVFTTPVGPMPQVVIQAWQDIWQMSPADLGGQRAYKTDFEYYDQRAADPQQACLDIYIGLM